MKRFFKLCVTFLACCGFLTLPAEGAVKFSFEGKRDARRGMDDVLWARAMMLAGADVHEADRMGQTPIFYAADAGDAGTVKVLLDAGAKVDTLPAGLSPLHFAKDAESVRLLVAAGADVNARGPYVPLPPLIAGGDESRYMALLEAGADAKFRTADGWTALHFPLPEPVVRALLAAGADPNVRAGKEEIAPLHLLLPDEYTLPYTEMPRQRTLEEVFDLESWDSLDEKYHYYGHWSFPQSNRHPRAARHGILAAMLDAGARVDAATTMGVTPLHLAADAHTTRMLLDAGARVYMLTVEGRSPLFYAQDVACLEMLVAAGADVRQEDINGETVLFFAKDAPSAAWLIEKMKATGQDPKVFLNEKSKCGRTALHAICAGCDGLRSEFQVKRIEAWLKAMQELSPEEVAAYRQRLEEFTLDAMLGVLLPAGADVNARDENGVTVAFHADSMAALKLLKEHGADLTVVNRRGETLLACDRWYRRKSPEMVQFLVDQGVNVNAISDDGDSALASNDSSDPEVVKILLAAGANPNPETDGLRRVKIPIIALSDPECVRLLLEAGADVNARDQYENTALHCSVTAEGTQKAELLLAAGADVNAKDEDGKTPLFSALDKPELVKIFIEAGADVNAKDNRDRTPLFARAFYLDNLESVKLMIEAGAQTTNGESGQTLLHTTWNPEIMKYLIENGADVNARNEYQRTPIFISGFGDEIGELTKILIEAGAEVNVADQWGNTPLHNCDASAMPALLAAGAEVDALNEMGQTPLHRCREEKGIRLLLAAGADVHAEDDEGRTPLHELVEYYCNAAGVRALVEAGAEVNAQDNEGQTPLFDVFSYNDRWESVADALLAAGAKVNATDSFHRTPLHHHLDEFAKVQWLLTHGANPNVMNLDGYTPLFEVKRRSIYLLMLQAGADPGIPDRDGALAPCVEFYGMDGKKNPGREMVEWNDDDDDLFDDESEALSGLGLTPPNAWDAMEGFMETEAAKHGVTREDLMWAYEGDE